MKLIKFTLLSALILGIVGCTGGEAEEPPPPGQKPDVIQGDPNMVAPEMRGGGKGSEKGPDAGQG